jgi:signal transduction histidine kinase
MKQGISLRIRIYTILTVLICITLTGGLILVWYTFRMERLVAAITEKDLASFETAAALETALVNQKGFVSYYFMDGDPEWLKQLGEFRQVFKERLDEALQHADGENERNALKMIELEYQRYIFKKDRVIELYEAGERDIGYEIHPEVRRHFATVLELCENYKKLHKDRIVRAKAASQLEATRLRIIAAVAMLISFLLAVLLALVLARQILGPVRQLALMAVRDPETEKSGDEVKALSLGVRGLIEDVDQTHHELEKSRESLLQAEKLALVGKLAAGMAHSIRNPFTSVKMRLFSLSRSLQLSDIQKEDFDVISSEIRHIDTIVQNFLEFSRPPKLKIQSISPSTVVDLAIQLLKHRLKSYNVTITVERKAPLSKINADPEQLKEVLVNLIVNACEAMEGGGAIVIQEEEAVDPSKGAKAVIRISDNGPGISETILDKVLQPFFTTKEEGTGLGLSIAARIIEEHRGRIDIKSKEGRGTTFIITLPNQTYGV